MYLELFTMFRFVNYATCTEKDDILKWSSIYKRHLCCGLDITILRHNDWENAFSRIIGKPERPGKSNSQKSQEMYRNSCAFFAINSPNTNRVTRGNIWVWLWRRVVLFMNHDNRILIVHRYFWQYTPVSCQFCCKNTTTALSIFKSTSNQIPIHQSKCSIKTWLESLIFSCCSKTF